ncbi:MAG: protein kinase domain-containing protein [Betaproteobacteria bacterium]
MPVRPALTVDDWNRLNRMLEIGLALPAADRTAWLAELPAETAHLRGVLTQLLAESEATGFATDIAPPTTVARLATEALAAMRRECVGDRVGPWRLERLLAEGGMGTVWVAQRADGVMKRTAALKLPRAEWVDRGLGERIARERAILARLQHPHIAVLSDAGVTGEGRPFLALEYVEGEAIDRYCRGQAQELATILRLMVQVVRAVAYAHSRLVIHRDLKPGNVLVMANGTPKLLDFGISKLIAGETPAADETALTRMAGRPLTLAYAAPEQVLGQPVTVASDVYSLGVMLFELLAGARLYTATTPHALEAEILRSDTRRPSDVAPDKARAKALRGDLDAIVLTALKHDPESRYHSAAELADDLERYLDSKPVRAQADSAAYRLKKFVKRNRLPVAAGSAVVLALAAGLSIALWQAGQARQQAAEARRQAEEARNQTERATALNTFVLSLIRQFDPNASQTSKAADLALLASIEQRIDAEFKGSPDQLLQLRVTVGDAFQARGQHAAARHVYRRAIADAEKTLPADHLGLLKARVAGANVQVGDDEAVQSIDPAIEMLRQAGPAGIEPLIDALLARVQAARLIGRRPGMTWDSLYAESREAHDLAVRHFGPGSARHLSAAQNLHVNLIGDPGARRAQEDRVREAFEVLEAALAAARVNPAIQKGNPDLLEAQAGYGLLVCSFRSYADGLRMLRDTVALAREHHTDDSNPLARALGFLGNCLRKGRDPEVLWIDMDVYDVVTRRDEPSPWLLARIAASVARVHCDAWRVDECADFTAKALVHATAMPAGDVKSSILAFMRPPQVTALTLQGKTEEAATKAADFLREPYCCEGSLNTGRAWALRLGGHFEEAAQATDRAIALARDKARAATVGQSPGLLGWLLVQRGVEELELQRPAQALALIEQGMPDFRKDPGWDVDWGVAHLAHGRALLANGRPAEALEALRKAYGFWLGHDSKSVWAAEAEYWFGKAWIANGDVKRGRWMVAEAKRALAMSPFKAHRALAAVREP